MGFYSLSLVVVELSFTSTNYEVDEGNGTVYVCIEKNVRTARDIRLSVTASVIANEAECKFFLEALMLLLLY